MDRPFPQCRTILFLCLLVLLRILLRCYRTSNGTLLAVGLLLRNEPQLKRTNDIPAGDAPHEERIAVFYNLFVQNETEAERVSTLVNDQFQFLNSSLHEVVYVNSIGTPLPLIAYWTNATTIIVHRANGTEMDTLQELWKYCKTSRNRQKTVVYLHSKGSYHPSEENDRFCRFVTRGALSHECATLPHNCTVCSSRMSPIPHSHRSEGRSSLRIIYAKRSRRPSITACIVKPMSCQISINECKNFFSQHRK